MRVALGITSKAYLRTAGTYAAPIWQIIDLIADCQVNGSWNEGESSVRRSRIQTMEPTNMALEVTGSVRKDTTDTAYILLDSSHRNGTTMDIMFLDGAINENEASGYRFNCKLFQWNEGQGLQDVVFKEFSVKPCAFDQTEPPKYVEIVAGVPVYGDLAS